MAKCKHCKREVTGRYDCEPNGSLLSKLADAVGGFFDALTSGGDSNSGCDYDGGD